MKKLLFLLLLSSNLYSQEKLDTIEGINYTIVYSQVKKQPTYIWYYINCTNEDTCYSRKSLSFHKEKSLKTSDDKDYIGNIYDKGHMIPVEVMCCDKKLLYESFSYLNCCLQHQGLNRGV